jgi:hypothetical protein
MTANGRYIVTLNLFQGPFLPARDATTGPRAAGASWMLKQVQHDEHDGEET